MSTQNPLVLVWGASGHVGRSIVPPLVSCGHFRVAAVVRPTSEGSPSTTALRDQGVEIRTADMENDSPEALENTLKGVDILIIIVPPALIKKQPAVLDAAKKVGTSRVVPCDFGTACVPGRHVMYNKKLAIREYVVQLGLDHTFIDIGWWTQLILPLSPNTIVNPSKRHLFGSGDVKTAITDLDDVGEWVVRIIRDPRTLNKYVFCWAEEVSQNEAIVIAREVAGEDFAGSMVPMSEEDILRQRAEHKANFLAPRSDTEKHGAVTEWVRLDTANSLYIHGDNTVANAKNLSGALDAQELYPDFRPKLIRETAKKFYSEGWTY